MILGAIHDRVWVALMLLTAAFGLGFGVAISLPPYWTFPFGVGP